MHILAFAFFAVAMFVLGRIVRSLPFWRFLARPSFAILLCLLAVPLMAITCTPATLTEIGNMIPSLASIVTGIFAFIAGLSGKTIPAATAAAVQADSADVQNELSNVAGIVTAAESTPDATISQTLQSVFGSIGTKLNSLLTNAGIKDPATVGKLTALVDIGLGMINTILGLVSSGLSAIKLHAAGSLSLDGLKKMDKETAQHLKEYHAAAKHAFEAARKQDSTNPDVNLALAKVKAIN